MKRRRAAAPYAKALFELAKERNEAELIGRELDSAAATFEGAGSQEGQLDQIRRRLASDQGEATATRATPPHHQEAQSR